MLLALTALAASAQVPGGEVIERVLAVVAGDVITQADVTAARQFGLVPTPPAADPTADTLSRLIDRSLELDEVDRYAPPEPDPKAIDGQLAAVRARFDSGTSFAHALAVAGMDEKDLRETIRQDLRIREYIDQRFTVPPPGDDEIAAYYGAHLAAFSNAGQPLPLAEVRDQVVAILVAERREALVSTWIAGLRLRTEITNVYLTSK